MELENLLVTKDEGIAIVTVNRPQFLNALNRATVEELSQSIAQVEKDDDVKALIITGSGDKSFVAGGDITYMQNMSPMESREFGLFGQGVLRKLELLPKPVIAAINGFCLGGGLELAMACDFRIASLKAKFGQPEVNLGVTPGFGGTQRLSRLVGAGMAKQLLFTGDMIDAQEALRIGLVNQVVSAGELLNYVKGIAKRIMSGGQIAVKMCKLAVNEGMQTDIDRAMTIEADMFGLCFSTLDQKEGMKAFAEKRPPKFRGK
jgi:enoyl-CoA hydratase